MTVREFKPEDEPQLTANAAEDQHVAIAPTHVVEDDKGRIIGYASIGAVQYFGCWLDSKRVNAMQSVQLLAQGEQIAREQGAQQVLMPCEQRSPFYPYMQRLGFQKLGQASFNLKSLSTLNSQP